MKNFMILFLALSILSVPFATSVSADQAKEETAALVIHIAGFENSKGMAKVSLVDSKTAYESKQEPFKKFNWKIINNQVTQTIMVPHGEYALKIFHDENNNNKLDTWIFGIPSEGYGFSNNADSRLGPPEYEKIRFFMNSDRQEMSIQLQ